jgi:XisH protein
MPARDHLHHAVRRALERDGWTVTHDPYRVVSGRRQMWIDLGAERLIAAERGTERIAVEVKTFGGDSDIAELEQAIGQYVLYRVLLRTQEPGRVLWLAVPDDVWKTLFLEPVGEAIRAETLDHVLRVDAAREEVVRWETTTTGER